jgi:hypothetical protein
MPASGKRRSTVAMRFGWGVLVGLSLTLFVVSIPARYKELAEDGRRALAQLGPGDDLLLRFLSQGAYALSVIHPTAWKRCSRNLEPRGAVE